MQRVEADGKGGVEREGGYLVSSTNSTNHGFVEFAEQSLLLWQ